MTAPRLHPDDVELLAAIFADKVAPLFEQLRLTPPAAEKSAVDPLDQIGTLKRAAKLLNIPYGTLAKDTRKLPSRSLGKKRIKMYIPRDILEFMKTADAAPLAKKRGRVSQFQKQLEKIGA